jgi:predicted AAA+ superfamily ATPase
LFRIDFDRPFVPDDSYIRERSDSIVPYSDIWSVIHRGSMPELLDPERDWEWFYRDYVRTYLERDIRRIINVKDEIKFRNFLTCLAARSGELLVYQELANEIGVTETSISRYISGQRVPKANIVVYMADALNTTTDYILGRTDE